MDTSSEGLSIFDLLSLVARSWKYIAINCLAIAVITAVIVLIVPEWYLADTTLLPPEETSGSVGLLSQFRGANIPMFALMGESITPVASTLAILESNTVAERIIEKFDLMEYYNTNSTDVAVSALHSATELRASDAGLVSVLVEDKDPVMAADIANAYVEELDRFNREVRSWRGKRVREFVESRLEATETELVNAEEALREFQEEYGAVQIEDQARATIEVMTELRTELAQQQMRLDIASQYASGTHPEVIELKEKIRALQSQLGRLEAGQEQTEDVMISISELPLVAMEYSRLFRDVTALNAVLALLREQLEQSKIEEAKDTPTVQVLDRATPPEFRHRPRRTATVIAAAVLAFVLGVLVTMFVGAFRASAERGGPAKRVTEIAGDFYTDLLRTLRIRRAG